MLDSRQCRLESEPEVTRGSPPPGDTQVQGQASVEQANALAALVGMDGGCKHSCCQQEVCVLGGRGGLHSAAGVPEKSMPMFTSTRKKQLRPNQPHLCL